MNIQVMKNKKEVSKQDKLIKEKQKIGRKHMTIYIHKNSYTT